MSAMPPMATMGTHSQNKSQAPHFKGRSRPKMRMADPST
eukprot:COSAG01_NODE_513_length_16049_cov_57.758056_8_plen_39_part_00